MSEAGKTAKCPWPAADSLAPHGSSVPGHPPEAVSVGAMDTGAGLQMLICEPVHSFLPVPGAVTQTESRPCLQGASDLRCKTYTTPSGSFLQSH